MKTRKIFTLIISLVVLIICYFIFNYSLNKPNAYPEDINITASLKLNNNKNIKEKYMLELVINKTEYSSGMIYPHIEGLGYVSFYPEDSNEFFIPSGVGSDYTEELAITQLKEEGVLPKNQDYSLIGFWCPNEEGNYKMRAYFSESDSFEKFTNLALAYVHKENRFGKDLSWVKIFNINVAENLR